MITLKSINDIKKIDKACELVVSIINDTIKIARDGVTTDYLDNHISVLISNAGAQSGKGYLNYPKNSCISVNDELVHAIPGDRVLKHGDLVTIDLFLKLDGVWGDSATSFVICDGDMSCWHTHDTANEIVRATEMTFNNAVQEFYVGNRMSVMATTIYDFLHRMGYKTNVTYSGHGIGVDLHEHPMVPNSPHMKHDIKFCDGLVLAIEPMLHFGSPETEVMSDGWTVKTKDRSLCCHYERCVAMIDGRAIILGENNL